MIQSTQRHLLHLLLRWGVENKNRKQVRKVMIVALRVFQLTSILSPPKIVLILQLLMSLLMLNLIGAIVGPIALGILVTVGIKRLIIPGNFPITRLQSVVRGRQARKREAAVKTIQAAFRERQQARKQSAPAKENKLATTKQSVVRFQRLSQAFEGLEQNKKQKDEAAKLVTGSLVATQQRSNWDETIHGSSNSSVAAGSSLTPENRHRAKRLPDLTVNGTPQNNLNPTGHGLWKSDDSRQNP